jgi:sugar fermentation stimulation protein A
MQFSAPLVRATLVRRYKRFLADVETEAGETLTIHCANPGAMTGLAAPGSTIWMSKSDNPKRKLQWSWELVEVDLGGGPTLVGINTQHPNRIVEEALRAGAVEGLGGYRTLRREVRYGRSSRIDLLLQDGPAADAYVEVKNVHLMRHAGRAEFPDAVTKRGAKHLDELGDMADQGARAVMLFLVQRADADHVALARDIDPAYGAAFDQALARGVEAKALACTVETGAISVLGPLPVVG